YPRLRRADTTSRSDHRVRSGARSCQDSFASPWLPLYLDAREVVTQDRAIFILAGADIAAQSQVVLVQLQTAEIMVHVGVSDDELLLMLGMMDNLSLV